MEITNTAYGTWSGGRFMHFGETLSEERFIGCIQTAFESGIRTFVTSDVYGNGKADELLGVALKGIDRSEYALVGMIGHDFYEGQRKGSQGYPRFTDPELRGPEGYEEFVKRATSLSLERCGTDHFDLLMLHNPDNIGYTSGTLWEAMAGAKEAGVTKQLGMAPGPANGFTLDLLHFFEKFGEVIDWSMLILNPLEPWPSNLLLDTCIEKDIKVLTRVVDYGGVFHDDLGGPDHVFKPGDHRTYRPEGWVKRGMEKVEKMRPLAEKYNLSLIEFASIWNLSQNPVECVVPTFIQEAGENARLIEDKIRAFGKMPDVRFTVEEVESIRQIGDNTGCMTLKGASNRHAVSERCDEWPMRPELLELAAAKGLGTDW
ncbi:aldo/keto reductase [Luteolibacter algae]|uniref:Aldo/keto reductase n=1 Tax=Luteolibacter algae TaxID=454151 RepID=A0ABW5D608_9BACT